MNVHPAQSPGLLVTCDWCGIAMTGDIQHPLDMETEDEGGGFYKPTDAEAHMPTSALYWEPLCKGCAYAKAIGCANADEFYF